MANTQYLKYKNEFKKQCIFNAIFGGLAIITIILLLFVPLFEIREFNILLAKFSLFDEIKMSLKSMGGSGTQSGGGSGQSQAWEAVASFMGIYQIIAIIMLAMAVGLFVYDLVKNITGIMNMDNYALEQYDKIKNRADVKNKKALKWLSSSRLFVTGICLELFYLFYSKFINKMISDGGEAGSFEIGSSSYFTHMTGVSGLIALPIVFAIGAIAAYVLLKMSLSKTRSEILKEDYGISENAPVAESASTANVNAHAEIAPTESAPANTPNDNTPKE